MFVIPHPPPLGDSDESFRHLSRGETVPQTYFIDLKRDDGTPVIVQYTSTEVRGGPGDLLLEIDILTAWLKSDENIDVDFTTEEGERWVEEIAGMDR